MSYGLSIAYANHKHWIHLYYLSAPDNRIMYFIPTLKVSATFRLLIPARSISSEKFDMIVASDFDFWYPRLIITRY